MIDIDIDIDSVSVHNKLGISFYRGLRVFITSFLQGLWVLLRCYDISGLFKVVVAIKRACGLPVSEHW